MTPEAWCDIRKRAADLDCQLLVAARESQATKLLMTIPGIRAVGSRGDGGVAGWLVRSTECERGICVNYNSSRWSNKPYITDV